MPRDRQNSGDGVYRATAETELDKRLKAFMDMLDRAEPEPVEPSVSDGASNVERYRELTLRANNGGGKAAGKPDRANNIHAGHRARLRQSALRDKELVGFGAIDMLELMLSFVVPQKDVNPTAHALLDKFGSVAAVLAAPPEALATVSTVTADAAVMLVTVGRMNMWKSWRGFVLARPADVADFFGSLFTGGAPFGTYAAYLDERFSLISVERYEKGGAPAREIIGSVVKYGARNVIVVRRDKGLFPDAFGLTRAVARLADALDATGTRLIDYIMYTDYGYYTLGDPPERDGDWYAQYVFVPEKLYSRSPRAVEFARLYFETARDKR